MQATIPSPTSAIPDLLPDELLERIIGNLLIPRKMPYGELPSWQRTPEIPAKSYVHAFYLEKEHLCAASSVSRQWRAIALPSLFREIRLNRYPAVIREEYRPEEDSSRLERRISGFLQFLDEHVWAGVLITSLTISDPGLHEVTLRPLNASLLPALLARTPQLRVLALTYVAFQRNAHPIPAIVDTLYIVPPWGANEDVLKNIFSFFSTVNNLHLLLTGLSGPGDAASSVSAERLRAFAPRSISFEMEFDPSMSNALVDALLQSPMRRSLTALSTTIIPGSAPGNRGLRRFLERGVAEQLVDLQCILRASAIATGEYTYLVRGLSWKRLCALTVAILLKTGEPRYLNPAQHVWTSMDGVLAAFVAAPSLSAVTIAVAFDWPEHGQHDFTPYADAAHAISCTLKTFRVLRTVTILGPDREPLGLEEQAAVADLMPELREARLLHFTEARYHQF